MQASRAPEIYPIKPRLAPAAIGFQVHKQKKCLLWYDPTDGIDSRQNRKKGLEAFLSFSAIFGHLYFIPTPISSGIVKDTNEMTNFRYGIGTSFPTIGLPRKYTQRLVNKKLPGHQFCFYVQVLLVQFTKLFNLNKFHELCLKKTKMSWYKTN